MNKLIASLLTASLLAPLTCAAQLGLPDPLDTSYSAASPAGAPDMIAARQHFFGSENVNPKTGEVDPHKVIISWFSVSSLAASVRGNVMLLDTYMAQRDDEPGWVPTTLEELIALQPAYIFIGHGHADHADTAGYIAATTGATVFGTAEHCALVRRQARDSIGPEATVSCVAVAADGAPPGAHMDLKLPYVCVSAVKHVHGASEPRDPDYWRNQFPPQPVVPVLKPDDAARYPPGMNDPQDDASQGGSEGGSVYYQFRVGRFAFGWFDTVGPLKERGSNVLQHFRGMPPTDVLLGAIWSGNLENNGLRDPIMYMEAISPRIFAPLHFDFDYGSFSYPTVQEEWEVALKEDMARMADEDRPELRFLYGPYDYVRPWLMSYDVRAKHWRSGDVDGRAKEKCSQGNGHDGHYDDDDYDD